MRNRSEPAFARVLPRLAAALLVGTALALSPVIALAQETPAAPAAEAETPAEAPAETTPETVVATVGGETITEADLAFAAEDLQAELQRMAPEDRRAFLVAVLIDVKVMAQAARNEGMDQSAIFKRRLQYLEERALRRAYFSEKIATGITPEAVDAAYQAAVAGFTPQEQVHARHILVATKEDADAIKAELAAGKAFETLAAEKSIDPSAAQNGGDLGFFSRGQMVKPFEDAAFALTEPGQISDPVESQFGWHVIRLEEKGNTAAPPIEQLRPQLEQQVMFEVFDAAIRALKAEIAIEIPDATLAEGVRRQSEGQAQ